MFPCIYFPGGSDTKESTCNAGDPSLIPGWGRSPAEGNVNPLQYSCLENSMDRGAWWNAAHGVTKNRIQLSDELTPSLFSFSHVFISLNSCHMEWFIFALKIEIHTHTHTHTYSVHLYDIRLIVANN